MYRITAKEDTIRIPPEVLSNKQDELQAAIEELTYNNFEGKIMGENELIISVLNIEAIGEGRIVHGDGGVYQHVKYDALIYKPELQEIVQGSVCEILKFGAFIRFGPLDGLLHISQIMDDHIDIDLINSRLIGKESKRDLKVGDKLKARIVAVSINERNPRESKIGLTMRQPGLGKLEWLEEDRAAGTDKPEKDTGRRKGGRKFKKR
ncbi:MAG: DNA-directed RNA polymerase, partial [Thermoplasmata archaeon]|nr:DNA-directed RNA polymerase [Thermoplasmata archaeon]